MSANTARTTACAALFFSLCSCSHPDTRVQRVALLPVENLTNDSSLDWIARAAPSVLAYDLTGSARLHPFRLDSIGDARTRRATRFVEAYFTNEHGTLSFHVTIENPESRRSVQTMVVSGTPNELAGAMDQIARNINPQARKFPACGSTALRLYGDALLGRGSLETVAQTDQKCPPVYLSWIETALARGDRQAAMQAAKTALADPNLDAIDRAEFDYLAATASGNTSARLAALQALARVVPGDSEVQRGIGELEFAKFDYQAAVRGYETAAELDPEDPPTWNQLGYARAAIHDLKGAQEALQQYDKLLPPGDPDALDSLGEVSFYLGDFAAAEKYFLQAQARGRDPVAARELLKAAEAHMMTGDLPGADAILGRHQWDLLDRAEWEFLTGRRKQAMSRLENARGDPRAAIQLAVWKAQTGQSPLQQTGGDPQSRALSLLLAGNFAEARPLLEQVYLATNPGANGQIRTLLAWADARTGRSGEAAKLLDLYPIPLGGLGEPWFASLVFPRFVELRGEILHSASDQQLAAKYRPDIPDSMH